MRALVISDVHSNQEALMAVVQDAEGSYDVVWCLGDTVGYGPNPNECVGLLQDLHPLAVPGNHDWAVLGKLDLDDFNPVARQANLWNREQLAPQVSEYLGQLPEKQVDGDYTLVHGSPRHAVWEYLLSASVAKTSFAFFETTVCFVGHTHLPVIFRLTTGGDCQGFIPPDEPFRLGEGARYIINPGSVGQPRDGDPRAAYLLLDTETQVIQFRRVPYDIAETQRKMREARLPARLSERLKFGL